MLDSEAGSRKAVSQLYPSMLLFLLKQSYHKLLLYLLKALT